MMILTCLIKKLAIRLQEFRSSESGMTLPMLALSMLVTTSLVGIAVDTSRVQLVQSNLQFSLDAAGLAAGSTLDTTNVTTEVTKYLNANFDGYLGATLSGIVVTVDSTNTVLTITANATLPTTFMKIVGVNSITLTATTQITRAVTGLELVMVLDNTGSMTDSAGGGVSKISALQTASTTLINTLFGGQSTSTNGKLWVGIVPFSQAVNIGTSHTAWMNSSYDTSLAAPGTISIGTGSNKITGPGPGWGTSSWAGCVDARQSGYDVTDDAPSSGNASTLFEQYYWPSDNLAYPSPYNNTPNGSQNKWATPVYKACKNGNCTSNATSCTPSQGYTCTITSYKYPSTINNTSDAGPNYLCPQQVTPMTNDATTLTNEINAMTAEGDTVISEGLVWGWRMLSPNWRGQWGGTMNSNALPLDYNTQGMNKAVVLLTDGENTIDNNAHGAYWFLENDRLGTTSSSASITEMNNRTLEVCNSMKAKGIYIYTIALGTDVTSDSLALLQSCATAPNYFFNSPSTTQLQSVFSAIGDSLSNLRVSK